MKSTKNKPIQFSLSYMFLWVTVFSSALACFTASLLGGNGRPIGYSGLFLFSLGLMLAAFLIGDPLRRLDRLLLWPTILLVVIVCIGSAHVLYDKTHWSYSELRGALRGKTKAEVRAILGEPQSVSEDGQWYYDGVEIGFKQSWDSFRPSDATIVFDQQGVVTEVNYYD